MYLLGSCKAVNDSVLTNEYLLMNTTPKHSYINGEYQKLRPAFLCWSSLPFKKLLESFPESKTWYLNFHWKDFCVELCCTFLTDLSESVVSEDKTAATILRTMQLHARNPHLILDEKLYANKEV